MDGKSHVCTKIPHFTIKKPPPRSRIKLEPTTVYQSRTGCFKTISKSCWWRGQGRVLSPFFCPTHTIPLLFSAEWDPEKKNQCHRDLRESFSHMPVSTCGFKPDCLQMPPVARKKSTSGERNPLLRPSSLILGAFSASWKQQFKKKVQGRNFADFSKEKVVIFLYRFREYLDGKLATYLAER